MGKLTAKAVEKAVPRNKEYKLHDGDGLFLRVRPSGAQGWLFSYKFELHWLRNQISFRINSRLIESMIFLV